MELNREQIIKALGYCKSPKLTKCDGCPREKEDGHCMYRLNEDALSLIKELTEEAQTYKKHHDIMDVECSRLEKRNDELTEENERWRAIPEQLHKEMSELMVEECKIARKLAVRKYREQLHRAFARSDSKDKFNKGVFLEMVDLIAKEMIGEAND